MATPGHAEAVARLVHVIESGHRLGVFQSPAGLGKSRVLAQALEATRSPARRTAHVSNPSDGSSLIADLARKLGRPAPAGCSRSLAWQALTEAVRLCQWQGLNILLVIDNCQNLAAPLDLIDLERLVHLGPGPETRLSVLKVGRDPDLGLAVPVYWALSIRLAPLTRTEAEQYVAAKLAAAGRDDALFTPRALARLHAAAAGVPRGLDRLAALALMVGALRGAKRVTPDVVDGVARECVSLAAGA